MSVTDLVVIFLAGVAAGGINAVVGSGSLISFPALVAMGLPPLEANITNTVGNSFGSVSGAIGYRSELVGNGYLVKVMATASGLGAVIGAILLVRLPTAVFGFVVPFLLFVAAGLVIAQPKLERWRGGTSRQKRYWLLVIVFMSGIYGGYFGAAQGVILVAVLAVFLPETLQRVNAVKNVLQATVNVVAAGLFIFVGSVAWMPALVLGTGGIVGGQLGARYGKRLSPALLRLFIVIVGVSVGLKILVTGSL